MQRSFQSNGALLLFLNTARGNKNYNNGRPRETKGDGKRGDGVGKYEPAYQLGEITILVVVREKFPRLTLEIASILFKYGYNDPVF